MSCLTYSLPLVFLYEQQETLMVSTENTIWYMKLNTILVGEDYFHPCFYWLKFNATQGGNIERNSSHNLGDRLERGSVACWNEYQKKMRVVTLPSWDYCVLSKYAIRRWETNWSGMLPWKSCLLFQVFFTIWRNSVTFLQNSSAFVYGLPWNGNLMNYSW